LRSSQDGQPGNASKRQRRQAKLSESHPCRKVLVKDGAPSLVVEIGKPKGRAPGRNEFDILNLLINPGQRGAPPTSFPFPITKMNGCPILDEYFAARVGYHKSRVPGAPYLAFEMWDQIRAQPEPFSPVSRITLKQNLPGFTLQKRTIGETATREEIGVIRVTNKCQKLPLSALRKMCNYHGMCAVHAKAKLNGHPLPLNLKSGSDSPSLRPGTHYSHFKSKFPFPLFNGMVLPFQTSSPVKPSGSSTSAWVTPPTTEYFT